MKETKRRHADYMALALAQAELAGAAGDVPVGCVIVREGVVIAAGHNTREADHTALGHAELSAIAAACRVVGNWRLSGCTLYVTLEPCLMCMGAILNARLDRVVFGAPDYRAGYCGSLAHPEWEGPTPEILGGILEEECTGLLKRFFEARRK